MTFSRRPYHRLFFCLSLSLLGLLLSGCQTSRITPRAGKDYQHIAWEHRQPGCQGEQCPLVNIDTLRFLQEPELNQAIAQQLLQLAGRAEGNIQASLPDYESHFLRNAQPGWQSYLQAKVREQDARLILVELSSYIFTGGAHGAPGRSFINYDPVSKRTLGLEDALNPGMQGAFWEKARQARQSWLSQEKLAKDQRFQHDWPFKPTANVGLGEQAVYLKYDVETIAPYDMGHIELSIPYSDLKGILKPQYLR